MQNEVTVLILTYNEAPNIRQTLDQLQWLPHIVVVDSFSDDETLDILRTYPQVHLYQRCFDTFAQQCNFGLQQIETEWVLSLDADYVLTDELIAEIQTVSTELSIDGYTARFRYCVFGHPLRGTLYPPRQVLYRRSKAAYIDDGHGHRVQVAGQSKMLDGYIHHDDRKPLKRWLWAQDKYMVIEARKLHNTPVSQLNLADRIRRYKLLAPFVVFLYCLLVNRVLLDGWPGWYYAFQRMVAEIILSIRLIELEKLQPENTDAANADTVSSGPL
jgi:glycosyltransferase involved in cell wall biosynthesis